MLIIAMVSGLITVQMSSFAVEEMTEQEIQLIQSHKARVRENSSKEINQNPTQDFCFHTHTQRCGHGAKDTGDEEWVQNAIKGGIKKLAFTDHIPLPDGYNKTPKSRMDIAEVESYLTSNNFLPSLSTTTALVWVWHFSATLRYSVYGNGIGKREIPSHAELLTLVKAIWSTSKAVNTLSTSGWVIGSVPV